MSVFTLVVIKCSLQLAYVFRGEDNEDDGIYCQIDVHVTASDIT